MTEETLFHEALAKPPADRAAFLNQACAGRPELRAAVAALLAAHEASGRMLDRPAAVAQRATGELTPDSEAAPPVSVKTTDYHPNAAPGVVIAGRYTLAERLGEGGMGEVWVAKQTEPVKRRVALKLIKAGMDTKAVLQRFDAERQALALMDHPNIARVLDGGMTADRRPFFVMEAVNGLPLTKFCDEAKLGIRERLDVFVAICQAVQHAHQKGVIHRDLKPSNILVTLLDGKPVPKVIDFGVAKAIGGKLLDESLSTQFGAVVGTFEYMSPEQAGYSGSDIDTRADIYSLGVILYELLTGLRPIDANRLKNAALTEMIRIVQEEEPSKPSTRLSTADALPSLAALRQTEPKKLMALLRGELDWVVMKCLEKQRDRRYETANGLARDIQRYLADEPVEARPPSAGYRLGKFLRRNKGPVVAAALVTAALVMGMAGTTIGLFRAEQQRIEAETARSNESTQRQVADVNRQRAQANFKKARDAVDRMLTRVGDQTLRDVPGLEQLRRQLLEDALEFNREFVKEEQQDPSVRFDAAWAYHSVADISKELDRLAPAAEACQEAIRLFEQLLVESPTERTYRAGHAEAVRLRGELYEIAGRGDDAERAFRQATDIWERLSVEYPDRVQYRRNLMMTYCSLYARLKGQVQAAEPVLNKTMALMKDLAQTDPDRAGLFIALNAYWHVAEGSVTDPAAQVAAYDQMIESFESARPKMHRSIDDTLAGIYVSRAQALNKLGRREDADKSMHRALELAEKLVADFPSMPGHRSRLAAVHDARADIFATRNRLTGAEETYQKSLTLREPLVRDSPGNLNWRIELAATQVKLGLAIVGLQLGNPASAIRFSFGTHSNEKTVAALDLCDRAIDALEEVRKRDAPNKPARTWLFQAYRSRGLIGNAWEDSVAASADFDEALKLAEEKDRTAVRLLRWAVNSDSDARTNLITHADRLARRGKHAAAFAVVEKVSGDTLDKVQTYNAACVVSRCAAAARLDATLFPDQRTKVAEPYAVRAMKLLRTAIERGYRNVAHMQTDADLEPLRNRDDFKEMLAELSRQPEAKP